jgi:hypothetical protein
MFDTWIARPRERHAAESVAHTQKRNGRIAKTGLAACGAAWAAVLLGASGAHANSASTYMCGHYGNALGAAGHEGTVKDNEVRALGTAPCNGSVLYSHAVCQQVYWVPSPTIYYGYTCAAGEASQTYGSVGSAVPHGWNDGQAGQLWGWANYL